MPLDKFEPKGRYRVEHVDANGKHKAWIDADNAITNQGKGAILDTFFNGLTQISPTSWYIGLIDGSGTPALAAGDTLASHAGWTENTSYTGNRQLWGQGSSSAQAVTNASPATFNVTATGTLYGIFVCSSASGTSGTVWSEAAFTSPVPVNNGDQMKVTYTLAT
jgi:hypothetical protein